MSRFCSNDFWMDKIERSRPMVIGITLLGNSTVFLRAKIGTGNSKSPSDNFSSLSSRETNGKRSASSSKPRWVSLSCLFFPFKVAVNSYRSVTERRYLCRSSTEKWLGEGAYFWRRWESSVQKCCIHGCCVQKPCQFAKITTVLLTNLN